jgi:hypothetical protein
MQYSHLDTDKVIDWLNLVTSIHNNVIEGKMFSAGFNLACLQQCLVEVLRELEKRDKEF